MIFKYDKDVGLTILGQKTKQERSTGLEELIKKGIDGTYDGSVNDFLQEKAVTDNKSYLAALKEAVMHHNDLKDAVIEATEAHNNFSANLVSTQGIASAFGGKIKNLCTSFIELGKVIGATLLNTAIITIAAVAIGAIINKVYELATASEKIKESGQEAKNSIEDMVKTYNDKTTSLKSIGQKFVDDQQEISSTSDAVESLAEKYVELSKNVNLSTNENNGLDTDDYQSFLEIGNQLSKQFPSLVSGYDAQGNAILNLGNNAIDAKNKLQSLLEMQQQSAHVNIKDSLQTAYEGTVVEYDEAKTEYNQKKNISDASDTANSALNILRNNTKNEFIKLDNMDDYKAVIDELEKAGVSYSEARELWGEEAFNYIENGGELSDFALKLDNMTKEQGEKLSDVIEKYAVKNSENLLETNVAEQKMQDVLNSLIPSISAMVETSSAFDGLNTSMQNALINGLQSGTVIDLKSIIEQQGKDADIQDIIYENIITPISQLTKEEQNTIAGLFEIDKSKLTVDQYISQIDDALKNMSESKQEQWKNLLGIEEFEENYSEYEQVVGNALTKGKGELSGLTTSDMQIAYDLVVNDGFTGTFEQLKNEIARRKAELIDLNSTPLLAEVEASAATENEGSAYDKMREALTNGKELADKGLYGTDDFKSIAKMFSMGGMDDKANWEENLPKMEKYFTEGKSGINSFLEDLSNKGLANKVKGNWDFSEVAKDYNKAAQSMGMSTETFLAIFGKMNEYGIKTNFFTSQEEGMAKLKGQYLDLANAEDELQRLRREQPNNKTAIDAQKQKVTNLKQEIKETTKALEDLLKKDWEEIEAEQKSAETTISSLISSYNENYDSEDEFSQRVAETAKKTIEDLAEQYGLDIKENKNGELRLVVEDKRKNKGSKKDNPDSSNVGNTSNEKTNTTNNVENTTVNETKNEKTVKTVEMKYYANTDELDSTFEKIKNDFVNNGVETTIKADDSALINKINEYNSSEEGKNNPIVFRIEGNDAYARTVINGVEHIKIGDKLIAINANQFPALQAINTVENTELKDKSFSITAKIKVSAEKVVNWVSNKVKGITESLPWNKKSKFNGTFHYNGTVGTSAFAYGTKNVSIDKNQEALINEVGKEGVVRNGKLHTYNNGYPTKVKLKRGDIVFNHKQMEDLEKHGKVTGSHAKIVGGSSAFANGTLNKLPAFTSGSSSKSSSSDKKTKLEKTLEKLGKKFDWLEIKLTRLGEASDRIASKISDFVSITRKASLLRQQMKSTNKEQWANYNGYYEYMQNANEVARKTKSSVNSKQRKFLTNAFKKVRNGTINISSISNDNIRSAVEEYKKYYDAAIKCKDAVEELRQEQLELYKELINLPIERATKKIENLERNFNSLGKRIKRFNADIISAQSSVAESGESAVAALAKAQNNKVAWAKKQYNKAKTKKEKREAYAVLKQAEEEVKLVNKYKDKPLYEYQNALAEQEVELAEQENQANQIAYNTSIKNRRNQKKAVDDAKATRNKKRNKLKQKKTWKKLSKAQKKAVENGEIMSLDGLSGQALKDAKAYNNAVRNLTQQTRKYNTALDAEAQAAENAQVSQAEMIEAQIELAKTKFENVKNYYDMEIEYLDALASKYENQRKLAEALGQSVSESTLKGEEEYYNEKLTELQEKKAELQKALNEAEKDGIKKDTQEYKDLEQQLIEVDNEIADVQVSLIELHNEMLEIKYENMFDKHIEDAERFRNKLDTIQGLITDEMMYNDDGSLTEYGQAALSLEYQQYESALEDINRLNEKRKQIEEDYNNGLFESEEQYQEAVKETEDQMMDAVQTAASSRQQILDIVTKAAEKELEALNEVIDARKEALQKKKDYYEWDKQLKSKNKEINLLKQQIAALDGVANAESRAKKARLEAELKEQQEDLNDSIQEHLFELQIEGLDDLKETLQKNYEDYVEELARNLDEIEQIMADVGVSVNNAANTVETAIDRILESYGVEKAPEHNKTEEPVTDNNNNNNNVEMGQMKEGSSGSLNGLSKEPLEDMEKPEESTIIKTEDGTVISSGVTTVSAKDVTLKGSTSSQLDKKIDGSYAKGTTYVPKNGLYEINEKGSEMIITPDGRMLMPLAQGTGVLPNDITGKLWDMAKNYTVGNNLPTLSDITTNNNNISYGSLLTVNGDVTKDVLPELQEILKKAYQYTVNEMRKDHRKNGRK